MPFKIGGKSILSPRLTNLHSSSLGEKSHKYLFGLEYVESVCFVNEMFVASCERYSASLPSLIRLGHVNWELPSMLPPKSTLLKAKRMLKESSTLLSCPFFNSGLEKFCSFKDATLVKSEFSKRIADVLEFPISIIISTIISS